MKENLDPRMHTAEHILNQTMVRKFNCGRCFSAHIEKKKSKCDYYFKRALSQEEIKGVEEAVNEIIKNNLPVSEAYMEKQEAERLFSPGRPLSTAEEKIRIIRIGDYDAIPCIGSHVNATKELSCFKIISASFENETLRIRYKLTNE